MEGRRLSVARERERKLRLDGQSEAQQPDGPPAGVVELARRVAAAGDDAALVAHESLARSVYRLRFEAAAGAASIVVKRLPPRLAHANRLVAERWLPAVGLNGICPAVRGLFVEQGSETVWQLYEDVGGQGVDCFAPDPAHVGAIIELLAELHGRFAEHSLLVECREHGFDLGIGFLTSQVARASGILASIEVSREQAQLRDRLRERVEGISRGWQRRVDAVERDGGCATLLHGDLWPTNTLVLERNGRLAVRLIDWDHVGVGPIAYDVSTFLYRFPAEHRPWILARYRDAIARQGLRLPDDSTLNLLCETAEYGRYVWCLAEAAAAARRGEGWAFAELAEIETWFAQLELAAPAVEAG